MLNLAGVFRARGLHVIAPPVGINHAERVVADVPEARALDADARQEAGQVFE